MRGKSQQDKVLEQLQKQRRQQTKSKDNAVTSLEFSAIQINEFNPSVDEYLKSFPNLENVEFKRCKLQSLNGLSENKKILQLNLEENQLDGTCIKQIVQNFPSLVILNLKKNQIKEINELEELKNLSQLTHLSLDRNPVKDADSDFVKQVWAILPNLKVFDGYNSEGKIVKDKEEDYGDEDEEDSDAEDEEEIDDDDESFSMGEEDDDEDFSEVEDSESYSNKKKNLKKKVKK